MQIAMSSRDNSVISQLRTPTEIVRDVIYYNALSIRLSATVLTVRCVRLLWCIYQSDFFTHPSVCLSVAMWQLTMCCQLSIDLSATVTCMSVDLTYMLPGPDRQCRRLLKIRSILRSINLLTYLLCVGVWAARCL